MMRREGDRPETLYIVMPAYNEEANIRSVVEAWYPLLEGKAEDSRLVIADSGSTDRTHAILTEMQKSSPKLEILENTGKQHGPKVISLYDHAIRRGAGYVFQTDSDGQTSPEEFPAFWELRHRYDGVFGNRTVRGDGQSRAFVEKVVCLLVRLFFGVSVPDANAPFRLMKTETVKKYLYRLPADYHIPNIMITVYFAYFQERAEFRTITFRPRQGGVNSIDFVKITKIGWKALKDFLYFRKDMKSERSARRDG